MASRCCAWGSGWRLRVTSKREHTPPPQATAGGARHGDDAGLCDERAPEVKAGEPVEVVFQLSNPTAQPLFVLDWHTPLEGLLNDFFEVTRDGTELSYRGPC